MIYPPPDDSNGPRMRSTRQLVTATLLMSFVAAVMIVVGLDLVFPWAALELPFGNPTPESTAPIGTDATASTATSGAGSTAVPGLATLFPEVRSPSPNPPGQTEPPTAQIPTVLATRALPTAPATMESATTASATSSSLTPSNRVTITAGALQTMERSTQLAGTVTTTPTQGSATSGYVSPAPTATATEPAYP